MIIDFFDSLTRVFSKFDNILNFFTETKNSLETILLQIESFSFLDVISPYLGTIRYVAGDTVYLTLARILQIGFFLLMIRTLYQLIDIVINSFAVQKPLSIIKSFIGL